MNKLEWNQDLTWHAGAWSSHRCRHNSGGKENEEDRDWRREREDEGDRDGGEDRGKMIESLVLWALSVICLV